MEFTFYIADAFINPGKLFSGNPAAVVILRNDNDIPDEKKQLIASQFNLSETVFISKAANDSRFLIRWFTPVDEVKLCGHATLATSYILYTEKHMYSSFISSSEPIQFKSHFGEHVETTFKEGSLMMNFPLNMPAFIEHNDWLQELSKAILGDAFADLVVDTQLSLTIPYYLLRVKEEVDIFQLKPNFDRLLQVATKDQLVLVNVTKKANFEKDKVHFFTRVFAPWYGANEDPVCGSAFTVSAPYWAKVYREEFKQNIDVLYAFQASKRSGVVRNEILEDNRILIGGKARKFCSGTLHV